ncbi:unnamed protein product, partial [Rotaria sp. Silwood2]
LYLACKNDCIKSVFYLIEFGDLNVNERDCYGQTPTFYADASSDYDLVQYLISCNAKIDVRDDRNYLAIHIGMLFSETNQDQSH